jgi:thiol-disulfide isomerase/thioredoxin
MNLAFAKSTKWWEKGLQPNMREIDSAQDLVDSLANAGDRLVVVDFFSPGCGGCRALHPKVKTKRTRKLCYCGNNSIGQLI